ncbi:DUF262 domain-containing protein [Acinetobacter bouvetii]|uniref:DUF262 domain-containing protein n=1 Tax=Acinetobacter bouvetii TaxID=202951 RepID=A0A4Q7AX91_9GAMM|nr:DUF262 domain-containing protein [Acinetobacter bouvetii]QXW24780.1 DUF262 domain-containing HNH endonuclease family protein [Acinetobacter johnsonii]RZG65168.1 DUF262 domain-containing protein [Acinetobacter bouvetii]
MKASETKVEDFLSSNKTQFVIPVYQRNYAWNTSECLQLFNDIIETGENDKINAHFIGSIVYVHDDVYTSSKIKELNIIDGQQRLTTLTLIYLAIFHFAIESNNEKLKSEINETYLINKFASGDEKIKLRTTDNNLDALKFLLRADKTEEYKTFSKVIENFNFFKKKITSDNLKSIQDGLSKLMFVEVSLDREKDDPQRIFESLNSTGLELTQADLIRNYILMGLNHEDQKNIYDNYWETIEKLAKNETTNQSLVSDFIRDFLTLETNNIPKKDKVYNEFKLNYPTTSFEKTKETLQTLKGLVRHYNKLINPQNEQDIDIKNQLEYIQKLEINVSYPFLLKVYDDYFLKLIDKNTLIEVLELIQSYAWRRFIVGLQANSLNKTFMNLYKSIDIDNYLPSLQKSLTRKIGSQRFPKNQETIDALRIKDIYNTQSKNRTYFLHRLENHNNNEKVDIDNNLNITIEHIFPQNPDVKWKTDIGSGDYTYIENNYLHTIANLTLSGNNGALSNKTFIEKRDLEEKGYKDSRLWLNKKLASYEKWGKEQIEDRFQLISERFLDIWKIPSIEFTEDIENEEINIFDIEDATSRKLEYAIFFGKKIQVKHMSKLYIEIIGKLFELEPSIFFDSKLGSKIILVPKEEQNSLRNAGRINDDYFVETNITNNDKLKKIKQALELLKLEDELFIKYSPSLEEQSEMII